ncbi:MAG: hypothetical protein IPG23_00350 [Burkholderiales bacterium]|nr:hypothetical protein [Burkholderiales bacterium]
MMKQISERALVARVNRVLSKEGQQIFTCRQNSRWYFEIGTYYIKYLKKIHSQYMALSISTRWLPSWVLVHAWSNLPHTRVGRAAGPPGFSPGGQRGKTMYRSLQTVCKSRSNPENKKARYRLDSRLSISGAGLNGRA